MEPEIHGVVGFEYFASQNNWGGKSSFIQAPFLHQGSHCTTLPRVFSLWAGKRKTIS